MEDVKDEHKDRLVVFRNGNMYGCKYNSDIEEFEYIYLNPKNVLYHLSEIIYLEEGFTLRDYFNLVIKYYPLRLLDYFIDSFIDMFYKCPSSGCLSPEFDYLTLSRVTCYNSPKYLAIGYEEDGNVRHEYMEEHVEDNIRFGGVCKDLVNDNDKNWGVELAPLDCLLDHEILIDNHYVIIEIENNDEDGLEITNFNNYIIRSGEIDGITLYEFFKTIIWELSFFGEAEERLNKFDFEYERV